MTRDFRRYLALRPFTPKSLVLVMFGLVFIFIGINTALEPWTSATQRSLFMLTEIAPRATWGLVSGIAGALAIWSSRWPTMNDSWGFVALGALSAWWACAYGLGALVHGTGIALNGMLTWFGICVLLYAISRLADPVDMDTADAVDPDDRLERG